MQSLDKIFAHCLLYFVTSSIDASFVESKVKLKSVLRLNVCTVVWNSSSPMNDREHAQCRILCVLSSLSRSITISRDNVATLHRLSRRCMILPRHRQYKTTRMAQLRLITRPLPYSSDSVWICSYKWSGARSNRQFSRSPHQEQYIHEWGVAGSLNSHPSKINNITLHGYIWSPTSQFVQYKPTTIVKVKHFIL